MNTPQEQPLELELIEQSTEENNAATEEAVAQDILNISDEIAKQEEKEMNKMDMPGEMAA
ncbi:MAG TPA: hypothetical protein VHA78_05745 [Candidatus Peribacteraceae bacterium]|nr:hypothetical protein [Candidatus Peribacteraceae bacterium]